MPIKENKIDFGTIGSAPCQVALNKILIETGDSRITSLVMKRYNKLREGLNHLLDIKDESFRRSMMLSYYKESLNTFSNIKEKIPDIVYTHALCCFAALFRSFL